MKNVRTKAERLNLIEELVNLGVTEGRNGESLQKLDYYSLRSLLAIKKVVME
ncbi:hypothetical protein [Sporosarcina sp. FSL K6-5500]|uniref:hypothetical protein n=1 Tax=Sporosarcina sp. FSL K6-5500 TaxID=2921558 RepID=UPI0030FA4F91